MNAIPAFPALTEPDAVASVIALARWCGAKGWIPATSGNFSARIDLARAACTATGSDKTELTADGVITVDIAGNPGGASHPRLSAEGPLHLQLYRDDPSIGAIAHAHPLAAVLLSRRHAGAGKITFSGWEMQKAMRGVATHESALELPIFANDQDTSRLALRVSHAMPSWNGPVFGYLIVGHGLYAWGKDARETRRHLEAYAHLLDLTLEEERRP